jgi:hypothetical protein
MPGLLRQALLGFLADAGSGGGTRTGASTLAISPPTAPRWKFFCSGPFALFRHQEGICVGSGASVVCVFSYLFVYTEARLLSFIHSSNHMLNPIMNKMGVTGN